MNGWREEVEADIARKDKEIEEWREIAQDQSGWTAVVQKIEDLNTEEKKWRNCRTDLPTCSISKMCFSYLFVQNLGSVTINDRNTKAQS